ncbi:Uncharacterized protein HZ326_7569 [Fusarium oxysporum f. sp. albedinis]|nr:Uncharacterized protein HZ326_7569 [Fusarium oxysporum f. sp. albedinis]
MKRTKGLDYGKEKAEERQSLMYESTSFDQRRKLSEELYGKGLALIKAPTEYFKITWLQSTLVNLSSVVGLVDQRRRSIP